MPQGTPVNRQWVQVTKDGEYVIDWGDDLFQDIRSGEFEALKESDISHGVMDEELDWLKRIGRVISYDSRMVYFFNLPERPQKPID